MNLAYTEPQVAKAELRAMLRHQVLERDSEDFGFVPHMNYFLGDGRLVPVWAKKHFQSFLDGPEGHRVPSHRRDSFVNTYWSSDLHSDITQPPILAMAVQEVARATADLEFVSEMVPRLQAYYDYLHRRRADSVGLVRIIHPWESGWDNSQRWDEALGLHSEGSQVARAAIDLEKIRLLSKCKALDWELDQILAERDFVVKPVDFNVLYAKNLESLAHLCKMLGDTEGADTNVKRSMSVSKAIFEQMWDGDKYVDLLETKEGSDKRSKVKSAAMFYPLMLSGAPHSELLIHSYLANPQEFNPEGGYMIPTTSLDDPTHQGGAYWRGNVWGIVNFFVHSAVRYYLKANPQDQLAVRLTRRLRDSMFELLDQADFFEYFNPRRVNDGKVQGYGVSSFGWNGLALFMDRPPAFLEN